MMFRIVMLVEVGLNWVSEMERLIFRTKGEHDSPMFLVLMIISQTSNQVKIQYINYCIDISTIFSAEKKKFKLDKITLLLLKVQILTEYLEKITKAEKPTPKFPN